MKQKFYHCSPKRFKKGDTLVCPTTRDKRNYDCWGINSVFLNISPVPHFTIWDKITSDWLVYEVEPIGRIYSGIWDDIICDRATVIKIVGNAKGILGNYKKQTKVLTEKKDRQIIKSTVCCPHTKFYKLKRRVL